MAHRDDLKRRPRQPSATETRLREGLKEKNLEKQAERAAHAPKQLPAPSDELTLRVATLEARMKEMEEQLANLKPKAVSAGGSK